MLFSIQEKTNFPSNKWSQVTQDSSCKIKSLKTIYINLSSKRGEWIQSQPGSKSPRKSQSIQFSCSVVSDSLWPHGLSMPGLPIHHQPRNLLKLMSIELVMPSNHLILCRPLLLLPSIFPASGSFQMSQLFASGGQSIGVSASTSVLPMNIQDWFPLRWTGWIVIY